MLRQTAAAGELEIRRLQEDYLSVRCWGMLTIDQINAHKGKAPMELPLMKKPTEFTTGKGKLLNKGARMALKIS